MLLQEQRDPRLNEILHPPVSKVQAREMMERLEGGKGERGEEEGGGGGKQREKGERRRVEEMDEV